MKYILTAFSLFLTTTTIQAQIKTTLPIDTAKQWESGGLNVNIGSALDSAKREKSGTSLSIGSGGVKVGKANDSTDKSFEVQFGMLDLGINSLQDNTDYRSADAQAFLGRVDGGLRNGDLFSLRTSKSVNVNIYPIMVKAHLYKSERQKIMLASGVGLQLYNFRFTKPVSYRAIPAPGVVMDTISFSKNKLAFNYLTLPLMINAKTRISNSKSGGYWLTNGAGFSAGYLLNSWTKQISDERGKDKTHDPFNFRKTNFCVNGELGLDGYVRLYASYQLTSLHEDGLQQHPFSIGFRFLGL